MKNENAVKAKIKQYLKARGIEHITITTGGFGSSGWPDICFLYKGIFVGIECKFGKNKPSALQKKRLDYIKAQGGIAMLVNEDNAGDVELILKQIDVFWLDTFAMDRIKDACFKSGVKLWRAK